MSESQRFLVGEFRRSLDERFRLSIPGELMDQLGLGQSETEEVEGILAKERPGCLSLWPAKVWDERFKPSMDIVWSKLRAGKFQDRVRDVQLFGRLMSTRHKNVQIAGRGRLLIPEGFREFLRVEPGSDVMVIGAAVCLEIWQPQSWVEYLDRRMPRFSRLFAKLSG